MRALCRVVRLCLAASLFLPFAAKADPLPSTTYLSSSLNPSVVGDAVTFSALVTGAGIVPTGTATFKKYGTTTFNSAVTLQTVGAGAPVAAGYQHTCYVTASGGIKCAGNNSKGQLGDTTTTERHTFVDVFGLSGPAIGVSIGNNSTCAILADGTAMCWGSNSSGHLGTGAAGDNIAHPTPAAVSGLTDIKTLVLGDDHACALTNKGKVYCWGQNSDGQLGNGSTPSTQLTPVAVSSLTSGVAAIAAGSDFNCALTTAGGVKCWGHNFYGTVGNGSVDNRFYTPVDVSGLTSGVITIGTGVNHACAALATGGAQCWGRDAVNQLGDGTTGDASNNRRTPVSVLNLTGVLATLNGGYNHTCALTTDGAVYCWGSRVNGELGDNSTTSYSTVPVAVTGLSSGVAGLFTGYGHACAGKSDGSLVCWGRNFNGQTGDNDADCCSHATPFSSAAAGSMLGIAAASTSTSSLVVDVTPITAVYSGDGSFAGGTSNTINQSITGFASTTVVSASAPNPSVLGAAVTVTVTVTGSNGSTDGGTVTLKADGASVDSAVVASGVASFTISSLGIGDHVLSAVYGGNDVYNSSSGGGVTQTVQGATTLVVTATPPSLGSGQSATLTATVSVVAPAAVTPAGRVSFRDNGVVIGTTTISSGQAQLSRSFSIGSHTITATYAGNTQLLGSTNTTSVSVSATVGTETGVNTTKADYQQLPAVARLTSGYVVVWQSNAQDGSGYGIYAQRYTAAGAKVGTEFKVNKTTAGAQTLPAVAGLANGQFVVVWQASGQDSSGTGIYGQRFTAKGAPFGTEFRINTTVTNNQATPAIAALSSGDFVVTWASMAQDGSGSGIYAQRFKATGVASGGEFKVNTTTAGDQTSPAIASAGTGFVVAWQGPDASKIGILARRFDAASAPLGTELKVNTVTLDDQTHPAIAGLATGDFVVVWQSAQQDGSGLGIYMQRYTAAGVRSGANKRVNTTTAGDQASPTVAAFTDAGFAVAWTSPDGSGTGIYAQTFDNAGVAVDNQVRVNTTTSGAQTQPRAAAFSSGGLVFVWTSVGQDTSLGGIFAQRMKIPVPN